MGGLAPAGAHRHRHWTATAGVVGLVLSCLLVAGCSGVDVPLVGSGCSNPRDTRYIPTRTPLVVEHDGVQVAVQRVWFKTLAIVVSSSDGQYENTRVEQAGPLYEGLEFQSRIGFDWVAPGELEGGQVRPFLRVSDCWTLVSGPSDLW